MKIPPGRMRSPSRERRVQLQLNAVRGTGRTSRRSNLITPQSSNEWNINGPKEYNPLLDFLSYNHQNRYDGNFQINPENQGSNPIDIIIKKGKKRLENILNKADSNACIYQQYKKEDCIPLHNSGTFPLKMVELCKYFAHI